MDSYLTFADVIEEDFVEDQSEEIYVFRAGAISINSSDPINYPNSLTNAANMSLKS